MPSDVTRQSANAGTVHSSDERDHVHNSAARRSTLINYGARGSRVWHDYADEYRSKSEADSHSNLDDYDPHKHRNIKSPVGNLGSLLHVLRGIIGLGVFALPVGFYHTGMLVGTGATIIFGGIVSYGINLLMKTSFLLCKRKRVGYLVYGEAMQTAMEEGPDWMIRWSKKSKWVVNGFLVLDQFTTCCIYVMSVGNILKSVVDEFYCDMFTVRILMCMLFLAFFLISYVPNMKVYAYFSAVGNAFMYASIVLVLYIIFPNKTDHNHLTLIGQPSEWLLFVGICLFAMQAIGVECAAERHMERPQDFLGCFGVMNISMLMVSVTYWFVGFSGYWVYGGTVRGSLLNHLPHNSPLTRSVRGMLGFALLINFRLNSFLVMDIVWAEILRAQQIEMTARKEKIYRYALLTGFCVLVYVFSMALMEHLDWVAAIDGLVEGSMLVLGFPALMQICALWPDNFGRFDWIYYKDLVLFAFSIILFACGLYVTVGDLMNPEAVFSCATPNATRS